MRKIVCFSAIAICLAMVVLFAGCDLLQTAQNTAIEMSLNTAIDVAIDEIAGENEDAKEVADHIQAKAKIAVTASTISDDGVTATCLVTAPDMKGFIESFNADDYANAEEIREAVIAALDSAPLTQQEVTIELTKTDDGYEPKNVEGLIAAYFGSDNMDKVNDLLDDIK